MSRNKIVKLRHVFSLLILSLVSHSTLAQTSRFQKLGIELDPWGEAQVSFWKKIYTEYSTQDYVIHDSRDLAQIYEVQHSDRTAQKRKKEIQRFHKKDADSVRVQLGQRDRLENAYSISKLYLPRMQEMLEEEGVPKIISALPFVESGFNQNAKSSVGAIGIWQFMPQTAMRDLRVDSAIDERYDPLKSTRAAAKFLKRNEQMLKNWGLAIMAYHHGPGLVQKAVDRLKTRDPLTIIKSFKDPNFQFASRNYLFEFLAMTDVDSAHGLFFKNTEGLKLPPYITISFPMKVKITEVLAYYHLNEEQTKILNPHFRAPLWTGRANIPAHYPIRLAGITLEEFRKLEYPKKQ